MGYRNSEIHLDLSPANNRGTSFLLTGRRSLVICGKYLLIDESHGVAAHVEFELRR
jgi:hypothetical protein